MGEPSCIVKILRPQRELCDELHRAGVPSASILDGGMALTLRIESHSRLPDGGPVTYCLTGQGAVEIGRDKHLDWSLPDPERFVSGRHCQIVSQSGDYLLTDFSSNGTFINDSQTRVQSPYRLQHGDRIHIGEYVISVAIHDEPQDAAPAEFGGARHSIDRAGSTDPLWDFVGDTAPPADPADLRPRGPATPVYGDFLSHAVDAPRISDRAQFVPSAAPRQDLAGDAWLQSSGDAAPLAPEPRRRRASNAAAWTEPSTPAPAAGDSLAPPPSASSAPPVPAPEPAPASAPSERGSDAATWFEAFMQSFAAEAGLPSSLDAARDPVAFGALLGRFARTVAGEMQQLLRARIEAKLAARSSEHTMIEPQENNPLKFTPTPEEALRIMFGPPTRAYLDADQAVARGFQDLKQHQIQTFAAMQHAVRALLDELDPQRLEAEIGKPQGAGAIFKARKTQLWDAYLAAWRAQSAGQPDGVMGRYMLLFGEFYDRAAEK
jgi:type VI secretion system protein ImpI